MWRIILTNIVFNSLKRFFVKCRNNCKCLNCECLRIRQDTGKRPQLEQPKLMNPFINVTKIKAPN